MILRIFIAVLLVVLVISAVSFLVVVVWGDGNGSSADVATVPVERPKPGQ